MRFIEPVILNGINKDVAPNGIDNSNRKVLNPLRDALNIRYISSEGGEEFQVESIKGNSEITNIQAYTELTINNNFTPGLAGWQSITGAGVDWTAANPGAQISSSSVSAIFSEFLAQTLVLIPGTYARIRITCGITSGFSTGVALVGIFLDNTDNAAGTQFSIGNAIGTGVPFDFEINRLIPPGAVKIALSVSGNPAGVSSVFKVMTFSLYGYKIGAQAPGLNECIGSYENIEKNLLIYFLWNSNGYHGVFKYDSLAGSGIQILADNPSTPVLKFSNNPRYAITGIGMIGDIITWTDNLNPQRYINITRQYTTVNDFTVSLIKIGPRNKPTFTEKATASPAQDLNKLSVNSIQVAHRYVYVDNEVSVLSPYSDLIVAEAYGEDRVFLNLRNKVDITFPIDTEFSTIIKRVELLYRVNNDANWKMFTSYTTFGSSIVEQFTNNSTGEAVADIETSKIFDSIPNLSKALIVLKNRVFLNINEEGMEVPSIVVTPSLGADLNTASVPTNGSGAYTKKNGQYSVGIVASDKFGRFTGVYKKARLNGRKYVMGSTDGQFSPLVLFDQDNITGNRINVSLAGQVPSGSRYSIVLSPELQYEQYFQTWAFPFLYMREATATNPTTPNTGEIEYRGRVYMDRNSNDDFPPSITVFAYIHWFLPINIPFVPDTTYSVRIFTNGNIYTTERVLEVLDGNILVTGHFNLPNYNLFVSFIEVFKLKESTDIFYYEVAGPFNSSGSNPLVTSIQNIKADTYYRGAYGSGLSITDNSDVNYRFNRFDPGLVVLRKDTTPVITKPTQHESPTPTYKNGSEFATNVVIDEPSLPSSNGRAKNYNLDYSKAAWSKGRPFVEVTPGVLRRPATIRFSDVYVENAKINGLNSFPVENIYDKIGQDRSPITKFLSVGNVLMAVHERHLTTIYVGEGIVRAGETGFLAKVNDVVGDDRKLLGEHGSYHPESVQEVDGQAFGFDIFSGLVWRYTVEGTIAISDYGMKAFFRDKANQYFDKKDELKFVSSVDKYHREYLLTLPHKYTNLETADLQAYNTSTGSYDFELDPEEYIVGKTYRLKIVSFKQAASPGNSLFLSVLLDGTDPVKEGIRQDIFSSIENDVTPVYVEFQYNGEAFVRINISGINNPIYVRISTEYQEVEGETWAYNYEKKVWSHRYSVVPEFMGRIGNKVYSFKEGRLYEHNASDVYNDFYGIQYKSSFTVACNPQPNKVKVWSAIQIAALSLCTDESGPFKVMECSNDQGQASYTRAKDFVKREGVYYAPILRDVNTNQALLSAGKIPLRDGKDMRSKHLEVTIHYDRTDRMLLQKLNLIGEYSEFSA